MSVGVALFLNGFIIVNARVTSGSMENTIMTGDRVLGLRFSYWFSEPQQGDIVIFKYPDNETQNYIKRIIGLPGDSVEIVEGLVYVNGENAIPLYKWLTENTTFKGFGNSPMGMMLSIAAKKTDKEYKNNCNIKWNFTKFLIDRNGNIAERFEPTDMKNLKSKIQEIL